jgi:beta-lactamase regulating signal transducer with metallopeptidase domain
MMAAMLDHLWQSTLLALGVVMLSAAFRRAGAAVRYGLWFAASAKFLVPFAALAQLGRLLAPTAGSRFEAPGAAVIAQAVQPFSRPGAMAAATHAAPPFDPALILFAVWALGCCASLLTWAVRAARVRSIVRSATPLPWAAPMPVLASSSLMEPGLVGLWRPVLVVPKDLPEHLGQAEIDALLAHEACHLRRKDNLTAAVHMLVEALFWFHPLVWWIGGRLIDERERACDEAVVRAGHDRAAYARSLVESSRLYLQSPLACVAGASGSNLTSRVEMIMTASPSPPLSRPMKALLLAAGACALASPVAAGWLTSPAGRQATAHAAAIMAGPAPASAEAAKEPQAGHAVKAITVARAEAAPRPAEHPVSIALLAADVAALQPREMGVEEKPTRVDPEITLAASQASTLAAGDSAARARSDSATDPNRVICKLWDPVTGSPFAKRQCRTLAQWVRLQGRSNDNAVYSWGPGSGPGSTQGNPIMPAAR